MSNQRSIIAPKGLSILPSLVERDRPRGRPNAYSASCRIIVNQVKDTIVVPAASIYGKDSLKIVYVAEGEKFIPVTVETGLSNSSKIIVSKGLSGNETIALTEPPYNLISKAVKSK